ncbi:MAG: GNAT family N-acetyltransferase [Saprospiraceae bacterium]|nr:GNAT family N-acetyltransferase [Saprospiraceae bacterium]
MLSTLIATTSEEVSQVRELLWEYARMRNFDPAMGNYEAEFAGLPGKYGPPGGCLILAQWEAKAAGCVAFKALDNSYCEMKRLYVSPKFRGKQIGKALVQHLLKEAQRQSYRYMRLDSHPWMASAQGIYRHFGFEPISAYNDNPTPGIRFFEKSLAE